MLSNSIARLLPLAAAVLALGACTDAATSLAAPSEHDASLAASSNAARHTTANVHTHPALGPVMQVEGARAKLVTNDNGIHMTLRTSGLEAGHAYTIWWVIFNAPENCDGGMFGGQLLTCVPADVLRPGNHAVVAGEVAYATGHVVGGSGNASFAASLRTGPVPGGWYGNGLTNPRGADIHLVLMDHGPAIPGLVANQISTLRGGCTDASVPLAFPPIAHADGIPGPNTCRLSQFAVLTQ
jgi:hypothetical protein